MVRLGKLNEAISHLSTVIRLEPDHARAHGNLGSLLLAKGKFNEAASHLFTGVRLDPNNAEAHYSLALILVDQKKLDQALSHYSKAVQLKPEVDISPALHFLLAMNYGQARQFHKAFLSAQKAHDLAIAAGDKRFIQEIKKWLDIYRNLSNSQRENNDESN
jgi:tetratricopeptide (TPR) repeat protein